jgi:hypothetical protein
VRILKDLGKGDLAMQIARSVGPDWINWTRDPSAIEAARLKLGEAIDQVTRNSPTPASSPTSASSGTRSAGN